MSALKSLRKAFNPNVLVKKRLLSQPSSSKYIISRAYIGHDPTIVHSTCTLPSSISSQLTVSRINYTPQYPSLGSSSAAIELKARYECSTNILSTKFMSTATIEEVDTNDAEIRAEDRRAEVKQEILTKARSQTNKCKALFRSQKQKQKAVNEEKLKKLYNDWMTHEILLADAYTKAIKYTAKLREEGAALKAQRYLDEMIQRNEDEELLPSVAMNKSNFNLEMRGMGFDMVKVNFKDEAVDELLQAFTARDKEAATKGEGKAAESNVTDNQSLSPIPVPTIREFHNVLHSWASSKVKKKGLFAENLLYRMMELAFRYPGIFDMPNSKTFGLVVKCYAGSTYKESFIRIRRIHFVYDQVASMNEQIVSLTENDPFFLMNSIKGLQSYNKRVESSLIDSWLARLHSKVTNSLGDSNADMDTANSTIDVTGTYNAVIRGYGKLRGKQNEAGKAEDALKNLREASELYSNTVKSGRTPAIKAEVKTSHYNLVIESYSSSKDRRNAMKAIALLDDMIDSVKRRDLQKYLSPLTPDPDDQSFASTIHSLSLIEDNDQAVKEAEKALGRYESLVMENIVAVSPKVHNACMELYIKLNGRDRENGPKLLSMCKGIVSRIDRISMIKPEMKSNTLTSALLLKACSIDDGKEVGRIKRVNKAEEIFQAMKDEYLSSGADMSNVEKCYFYMMKCVVNNMSDSAEMKPKIIELFKQACEGGFVSADVLEVLRQNVSHDEFTEIVGTGRLADHWIKNVKSVSTLYTDGSTGGENKHARRKGKSTSGWARKQRERGELLQQRKQAKIEKKRLKKEREQRHSKK